MGIFNNLTNSTITFSTSENLKEQTGGIKTFKTGLATITLRNVYVFNTTENEAQIDTYLNQKATTYKKIETGTAKQWIQYSFTMSDEEYYEFLNRNNQIRLYSVSDIQQTTFAQENIQLRTVPFNVTIAAGGSSNITIVTAATLSANYVYLSYLATSAQDTVGRHLWQILDNVTDVFSSYFTREKTDELRNTQWTSANDIILRITNNGALAIPFRGYCSYYQVNKAI